ncbi:hypothetical protein DPMN_068254 [Dreissena polymorpha]|uniref:Uncharacterized protein n=1 Tax=Dreissena polymorpha TaxID=45954 RepID=A0A9D3YWS7_DREPO|nr:hypothetical protein DPMN_068254 [Dreissena polymorpha]
MDLLPLIITIINSDFVGCSFRFLWGVGTAPQLDDIVQFHNLTRYEKSSCVPATLKHNSTYFSTVLAFNSALNSKPCNSSSDGGSSMQYCV